GASSGGKLQPLTDARSRLQHCGICAPLIRPDTTKTGKVDPHHPKISGHKGNVLDIKWNPFDDFCIASCSEDTTIKVWQIPEHGILKNMTLPWKELQGHSRRVGLIEWHPTACDILFSSGYDYQVFIWKLDVPEEVIKNPIRSISVHTDVVLSISFNTDGSRLATSCKDKKIRVIDPRTGALLQTHRASKVLFLGNLKMLLSTGNSRWNHRQIVLWDQEDLSQPSYSEDLDGSSEKPYVHYLTEYRSHLPQKGMGVMPKRGLDVCSCEIFRFYKLVTVKSLIEPLSMIVPRRSESYQDDIYPMTAGNKAALTADEWIGGLDKGPVMMSLRPGSKLDSYVELGQRKSPIGSSETHSPHCLPVLLPLIQERSDDKERNEKKEKNFSLQLPSGEDHSSCVSNGDSPHCSPPKTENELRQMFYKQQDEIRRMRELLNQKDVRIKQLELEIKNVRNSQAGL
ncbi:hypothetical protein DNTS_033499, partial [Danionella cerebrum]